MKNALPPIALQLSHPDAFFYEVSADKKSVSGLFEAHDKGQPFGVSLGSFLSSAYTLDYIDDYDQKTGRVFVPTIRDGTDIDFIDWVDQVIAFEDDVLQAVLRHAVEAEFESEITRLSTILRSRAAMSSIVPRLYRSVDTEFCDAVTELVGIIQAVREYEEAIDAANPKNWHHSA